jgi:chemotaxis protein CheC
MVHDVELNGLERDALTELVNIGVSRAAASLRKMVGRQVLLSVPAIEIIDRHDAAALIGERETGELVAVRQSFAGAFSGRALLIFPLANSLELVRAVMGDEASEQEAADMEQEALAETGNIILNHCLGTMANMLRRSLTMTLPEVVHARGADLFAIEDQESADGLVLFLYINFAVMERDIRGYIAMLLDLQSMSALKVLVRDFIESVMSDDAGVLG